MWKITTTSIGIKGSGSLPTKANMMTNPVKPNPNAEPNRTNTTDDEDDESVISDGTETTKERTCCSDHDGNESDHDYSHCDASTCTIKSILKEPEADWGSIRSEGPWRGLSEPVLPQGPVREHVTKTRHQRSVSFDAVQLRHYFQTIGDNPSVPNGPPVQLDWKYEEEVLEIPINEYECRERKWKYRSQMVMNYHKRRTLLTYYYGFTEEELKESEKLVKKIRWQRSITRALEPVYILEDLLSCSYGRMQMFARKRKASRRCRA